HLEASIYYDEPADPPGQPDEEGGVDVSLPCTYGPDMSTPWVRVTANGYENSNTDGSWTDYLGTLGVWGKYSAEVENGLWEGFRPILYFEPSSPELLFHDVYFAWYMRMDSPPPDSVN